ncbi:MAG: GAF domain-containing protein [Acidobacteria bacterium]|nr:GAF domain-containing protein [Acidobacteriota bacterium]
MTDTPSAEAKLHAVINGARKILERETFSETARAIFDYCREMTGAVSGYVALLSDDGQENEVLFLEAGGMPCDVDPELPMPIRGLRAEVYDSHCAAYENDFMLSRWRNYLPAGHVAMANVLFAPLNLGGRTVGVIGLANKAGDFTDADAEIATVFGELAAIALQNSRHIELLNEKTESLEKALADIKTLRGLVPICAQCKKIRDDAGFWNRLESYLSAHTEARLSHGLCPDCLRTLYPEYADRILEPAAHDDSADEEPPANS